MAATIKSILLPGWPHSDAHDKCNGRMRCAASKACRAAPAASTREAGPRRRSQARCPPSPPPQPRPSVLPSTGGGWGRSGVQQAERGEECRSEEGPAAPRRTWYSQSGEQPEEGACGGQSTRSLEPDALQPPPVQPPPGHLLDGMRTAMQWQAERGGAEPAREVCRSLLGGAPRLAPGATGSTFPPTNAPSAAGTSTPGGSPPRRAPRRRRGVSARAQLKWPSCELS